MFVILMLIMLVAALNIVSGLIMLVGDKGPDIAILRTMGATQGGVMRIFLITGVSIGIAGTLAGCILGLLVAHNIEAVRQGLNWLLNTNLFPAELYFLSRLPSVVNPGDVLVVVAMTLSLSVLATIYPAWRAARLDPVEETFGTNSHVGSGALSRKRRTPLRSGGPPLKFARRGFLLVGRTIGRAGRPSGAGKSTLLHIAGLLEKPDAGEVFIAGEATSGMNDAARTALRRRDRLRLSVPSSAAGIFCS
jgi:hypothetical protein